MLLSWLARFEASVPLLLHRSAALLTLAADAMDGISVSEQCAAGVRSVRGVFDGLSDEAHAVALVTSAVILAVSFVVGVPLLVMSFFGRDPVLCSVPPPSVLFFPELDEQSEEFADPEVAPQLLADGEDSGAIEALCPATGERLGWVPADLPGDVHEKVRVARLAQRKWMTTSFAERRSLLNVLANYIVYEQKELCKVSCDDTGKTMLDASLGEILTTLEKLRWVSKEGERVLTEDYRPTGPMTVHKSARVEYMPLGVIAAIAPWNYPLHNLFNPVISSLFAGNAIVVKPSELTAYSSIHFTRIIRRALVLCGHSPDLVQVVVGRGDIGAELVEADIDKVFFTGSTDVGKLVAASAARRLLPVVLELGGKDPFIVCDDADVSHAADICLRGVFQNAGQNCIGVERVFLHSAVKTTFTTYVLAAVRRMRIGIDIGAMTMGERALDTVQDLVDDAVRDGATLVVGGKRATINGKGWYYEPTILSGVRTEMRIAKEEVFGPVMSIFDWSADEELAKKVNSCPFGLGSSIFSGNRTRANKILSALRVGMGNINDFGTNYLCQSMPFGGTKESGSDRFAGIEGLRGCCVPKSVTRDRIPGVKTKLPPHFKYPVTESAYSLSAEINDLFYSRGTLSKCDNIRNIAIMSIFRNWSPRTVGGG